MKSEKRDFEKAFIFAVLFATLACISIGTVSAATHYVNPGESIQTAVDNANAGDTIIVRAGTYTENVEVRRKHHLTLKSENGYDSTIVQSARPRDYVIMVNQAYYVTITGFTVTGGTGDRKDSGIYLYWSNHCNIADNNASNNFQDIYLESSNYNTITNNIVKGNRINDGILLEKSSSNTITSNIVKGNNYGIYLGTSSNNNTITNNIVKGNADHGIGLYTSSNYNTITSNTASNNGHGIWLYSSSNNSLTNNIVKGNGGNGITLYFSSNNKIYLNNFIDNANNVHSTESTNVWDSPSEITYTYNGNTYTNYMGNYWSDYTGTDGNGDGLGDSPYSIDRDKDDYPLMQQWENYFASASSVFNTGTGTYPSIQGRHEGTIKPSCDIEVSQMYTYPCAGTGGHTKSIEIYDENDTVKASGNWSGYHEDWQNITITPTVTLKAGREYRYVIETGSYPQIIHVPEYQAVTGGTITCEEFTDENGRTYDNWIPAIRLS